MRAWIASLACLFAACGSDELELANRLDQAVSLELLAPKATIHGGCNEPFGTRFCVEEYELVGALELEAREARTITVLGGLDDDQCVNQVWIKLVRLDEVGPVTDPGTILALPVSAEIEVEAGALHSVAFPQATVRIDQVGAGDGQQSRPPPTCQAAGRTPRS